MSSSEGALSLCNEVLAQHIDIASLETQLMQTAMQRASGNLSQAARLLGITRPQLAYRLRRKASPPEPRIECARARGGMATSTMSQRFQAKLRCATTAAKLPPALSPDTTNGASCRPVRRVRCSLALHRQPSVLDRGGIRVFGREPIVHDPHARPFEPFDPPGYNLIK
ncbi:helix-turn-helix domain-containing protein [Variovorax sp. J22R115]|nr:helix-turn-helix domain-containing protein [Variovorax sp. J22R115]MDM0050579.1 helix-turn-helix domain-containing protein [Variovorax sp. J22R115]